MALSSAQTITQLKSLYKTEEYTRSFFAWGSGLVNDVSQTPVSRIEFYIGSQDESTRKKAIDFCKKLEAVGCGKLILGRHGRKSRMQWTYTLRSIGAVACGQSGSLEPREIEPEDEEEDDKTATIESKIPLSGGTTATLILPEDLSELDVIKLVDFIKRQTVKKT